MILTSEGLYKSFLQQTSSVIARRLFATYVQLFGFLHALRQT